VVAPKSLRRGGEESWGKRWRAAGVVFQLDLRDDAVAAQELDGRRLADQLLNVNDNAFLVLGFRLLSGLGLGLRQFFPPLQLVTRISILVPLLKSYGFRVMSYALKWSRVPESS
jgi:hypothetical protein